MVRGNDIRERSMGVGVCIRQKGSYDDLCGARVIGFVGLREEIGVQENDIHEHLAEVDVCVRQPGTYDDWCDMEEMTIDGHHVKIDCPQPKSGTGDGVVGSGYSGGSPNLFHRSKVY